MKKTDITKIKRVLSHYNPNNPQHKALVEAIQAKYNTMSLKEEKQRDVKTLASFGTTVYISSKFRKGAGGGDIPKLKLELSLTPGKAIELYRPVADESESEKFALAIKLEYEKIFKLFDQKIEELKNRYQLKVDDDSVIAAQQPTSTPAPAPEPAAPEQKPAAPAPAPEPAAKTAPTAQPAKSTPAPQAKKPQPPVEKDPTDDTEDTEDDTQRAK